MGGGLALGFDWGWVAFVVAGPGQRFREMYVMGMEQIRDEAQIAGFRLENDTEVEVYRPEEEFHAFFTPGPVIAFLVCNRHCFENRVKVVADAEPLKDARFL